MLKIQYIDGQDGHFFWPIMYLMCGVKCINRLIYKSLLITTNEQRIKSPHTWHTYWEK